MINLSSINLRTTTSISQVFQDIEVVVLDLATITHEDWLIEHIKAVAKTTWFNLSDEAAKISIELADWIDEVRAMNWRLYELNL